MRLTHIATKEIEHVHGGELFKVVSLHHIHNSNEYLLIDSYPKIEGIPAKTKVYVYPNWIVAKREYKYESIKG